MSDNYLFKIDTTKSTPIRILVESLKEILTDASFIINNDGIQLTAMDPTHTVLIHLKLSSSKFETFYCKEPFKIGLNMLNLFKLIKTMGSNDTLSLFVEEENTNKLCIVIFNEDKNSTTKYKLNLLDLDDDEKDIPEAEFDTELTIPCQDFQKLIRDMSNISDKIEIKSYDNIVTFECDGDFASQVTTLTDNPNNSDGLQMTVKTPPQFPVQGLFSIKFLLLFTRCTNLCQHLQMYIKNNYPLIVKYQVASLGDIKLCLAPITS